MDLPNTARRNLNPPTQGDDAGYELEFTKGGQPIDITGWTITLTVKRRKGQASPDLQKDFTVTDGPNGLAEVSFSSTDTADLSGLYHYDIQVEFPDGSGGTTTRTIMTGSVPFTQDVTD